MQCHDQQLGFTMRCTRASALAMLGALAMLAVLSHAMPQAEQLASRRRLQTQGAAAKKGAWREIWEAGKPKVQTYTEEGVWRENAIKNLGFDGKPKVLSTTSKFNLDDLEQLAAPQFRPREFNLDKAKAHGVEEKEAKAKQEAIFSPGTLDEEDGYEADAVDISDTDKSSFHIIPMKRHHNPEQHSYAALNQRNKAWGSVFYRPNKVQRTFEALTVKRPAPMGEIAQLAADITLSNAQHHDTEESDIIAAPWVQKEHTAPMHGGVSDVGQFYVDVSIGDPPQRLTAQIDTGSTTIAFPAIGCKQVDASANCDDVHLYDYTASNFSHPINCHHSDVCTDGSCSTWQHDACGFSLSYADQSGADGFLVHDKLRIYGRQGNPLVGDITFGAIKEERGKFQEFPIINGIIGMAFAGLGCNPSCTDSLIGQVHTNNAVANRFGICLGQGGGALVVGGVDSSAFHGELEYVKMTSEHYYEIALESVALDNKKIEMPASSAMIDSGTTLLLLNSHVWDGFLDHVREKCISPSAGNTYPTCPRARGSSTPDLDCRDKIDAMYESTSKGQCYPIDHSLKTACFPDFSFNVKTTTGTTKAMVLKPDQYIYVLIDKGRPYHCPAVNLNRMAQITFGDAFMQAHYIDFDREHLQLGFAPANADKCGGNTQCHANSNCASCSSDPACFWAHTGKDANGNTPDAGGKCVGSDALAKENVCSNHIQREGSACQCIVNGVGVPGKHIAAEADAEAEAISTVQKEQLEGDEVATARKAVDKPDGVVKLFSVAKAAAENAKSDTRLWSLEKLERQSTTDDADDEDGLRLSAAAKRPKITGDAKLALQAPVDPDGPTYHLMSDGEVNAEWNAEATSRLAQAARRPDENGMLSIQENEQAAEAAWSNPERASGGSFRWSAEGGTALSETEKQQAVFLAEELDVVPDLPKPATSFTRRWIADDAVTETELAERLARNGQNLYERPPQYAKLATPTGAGGASVFQLPAYAALVGVVLAAAVVTVAAVTGWRRDLAVRPAARSEVTGLLSARPLR